MNYRNFCDYDNYFIDQAGGKLDIAYYKAPYQTGRGRFSAIARKYGIPAMKYLFRHGYEFGKSLFTDVREGKDIKESMKSNLRKRTASAIHDLGEKISQSGSGMRKKPRLRNSNKKKRINRKSSIKRKRRPRGRKSKSRKIKRKFDIFN